MIDRPLATTEDTARRIAALAAEKKATDILVLDLRNLTSVCDYFVVASADSEPQIKAVVGHIRDSLAQEGQRPWHVEGMENKHWIVLDYVDIVVHVFREDARRTYSLERLWADAPRLEVEV